MKSRSAPIDIAALRKFITLDPKLKDVCAICRRKMRPPGPNEERTPTCDNCSQDIVLDMLPTLLDELEAARRAPPKPEPKPAPPKPTAPRKKVTKTKPVKAQPALKKLFKRLELAPRLEPEDHPERLKPEGLRSLMQKDVKPELEESKPEVEAEEPEPIELEREELEPEPDREPEREESKPELEIDDTTEVSALALALEEIEPPPPRRRRVQFTPANPKEVQAAVIQLRAKFEK